MEHLFPRQPTSVLWDRGIVYTADSSVGEQASDKLRSLQTNGKVGEGESSQ